MLIAVLDAQRHATSFAGDENGSHCNIEEKDQLQTWYHPGEYSLTFNGTPLNLGKTLEEYKIEAWDTIAITEKSSCG